jgi:tRNA threonylcarbamoyladenosine biosynthesis protein TsaB
MYILALDTTTREGSVALIGETGVVAERPGDGSRTHAERLPGELLALGGAHGLAPGAVDLFAVAAGPGSFTGLRIGIATIQGLALAAGRRIVAVSALEALAQCAAEQRGLRAGSFVGAWMDARRHDVFAALYRAEEAPPFSPERLVCVEAATAGEPAATLARWRALVADAPVVFVGDGAVLYAEIVRQQAPAASEVLAAPLIAGAIGRMAMTRARRGDTIDPAAVHPIYVRRPDAELAREAANPLAPRTGGR